MSEFSKLYLSFKSKISSLQSQNQLILEAIADVRVKKSNEFQEWGAMNDLSGLQLEDLKNLSSDKKSKITKIFQVAFNIQHFIPDFLTNQQIISLYTYFEAFLKDCLKQAYSTDPRMLLGKEESKQVDMKIVLEANSIEEIINSKIEIELNNLRGRIESIIKDLNHKLSLEFKLTNIDRKILTKFSDVRNLIVHRDGTMDSIFLKNNSEFQISEFHPRDYDIFSLQTRNVHPVSGLESVTYFSLFETMGLIFSKNEKYYWKHSVGHSINISKENLTEFSETTLKIAKEITDKLVSKFS